MTTKAVKEKKIVAAEKRQAVLATQIEKLTGKLEDLNKELEQANKHLEWVSSMPVDEKDESVHLVVDEEPGMTLAESSIEHST